MLKEAIEIVLTNDATQTVSFTRRIVMRFYPHVKKKAFHYTIFCYLLFALVNVTCLHLADPYWTAMVTIGAFWLIVQGVLEVLYLQYTRQS